MITNIISKLLAMIMLLLIPISIIGMFFNFHLFAEILTFDFVLILAIGLLTNQIKINRLQRVGYSLLFVFYFSETIVSVFMDLNVAVAIFKFVSVIIEGIGLAIVIGGKEVKEDAED